MYNLPFIPLKEEQKLDIIDRMLKGLPSSKEEEYFVEKELERHLQKEPRIQKDDLDSRLEQLQERIKENILRKNMTIDFILKESKLLSLDAVLTENLRINWVKPDLQEEAGEYFENNYTKKFLQSKGIVFKNQVELLEFLKTGKLTTITKDELLKNSVNLTLTNKDFLFELQDPYYRESFESMKNVLLNKKSITLPAPIILNINGTYFGFAGNRRMNLAFRYKLPLKAWLVKR